MKGKQLECIRKGTESRRIRLEMNPIGFVVGRAEALVTMSPRNKKIQTVNYLKGVSLVQGSMASTVGVQSESNVGLITDLPATSQVTSRTRYKSQPKRLKGPDLNSDFAIQMRIIQGKKLDLMNKELFPQEFQETGNYVPEPQDYFIRNRVELEKKVRVRRKEGKRMCRTIANLIKPVERTINFEKLEASKFETVVNGAQTFRSRERGYSRDRIREQMASLTEMLRNSTMICKGEATLVEN